MSSPRKWCCGWRKPEPMMLNPAFDPTLLSRIEDAGLNASAPPQQRWMDGWLVRFSDGKAKRARCINAVASGRMPVEEKLAVCSALFTELRLPLFVRITPFSQPADIDRKLADVGMTRVDDTRVMVWCRIERRKASRVQYPTPNRPRGTRDVCDPRRPLAWLSAGATSGAFAAAFAVTCAVPGLRDEGRCRVGRLLRSDRHRSRLGQAV